LGLAWATVGIVVLGPNATTLFDPGCTAGKDAIFNSIDAMNADLDKPADPSNNAAITTDVQSFVAKLNAAADQADNDQVRQAIHAVSSDFSALLTDVNKGIEPGQGALDKLTSDAGKIDQYCTIGG
jgi:hypothetical protein